jgi:hypothetical protein
MHWVTYLINWIRSFGGKSPAHEMEPPPVQHEIPSAKQPESKYIQINFRDQLIKEAEKCIGVHESGGNNKGPAVERFQKAVDGRAQGEPWCAAFVQFCINEVEAQFGATVVVHRSEHCLTIWAKTPGVHRYKFPKPGFLVIWGYEDSLNGHIGIVTRVIDDFTIETIEGNTSPDDKTVEREGDGVYRKTRSLKAVGKMKLVGFICPFNPDNVSRPEVTQS